MTEDKRIGNIVTKWYDKHLAGDFGSARRARALLRRCVSPADALMVGETHELNHSLKRQGQQPTAGQLALIATTFARLRGIQGAKLAVTFGSKPSKDGPRKLSELRFQTLIRVRTHRDLIAPLRRSIDVLRPDTTCNGWVLSEDLYFWSGSVRNQWCFQYFGAEFAGPNGEFTQ